MISFVNILMIDGKPVAHMTNGLHELLSCLLNEKGPFVEKTGYSGFTNITTVEQLSKCFDIHAGVYDSCFDLYDRNGNLLNAYILQDPFYIFEIYDAHERAAIEDYCRENGIESEN